jgi:2-methylcitrate dehydratase PrpD
MGQEIETLARFAAGTSWEDLPVQVKAHAKLVFLDTLGVILAGSVRPEVAELRCRLSTGAGRGATLLAPGLGTQDPRTAALLNGVAGRAIELCEGLRLVSGQAAMQVLPGILALAESASIPGRELMTSFVVGYEIAGRLCAAFTPRPLAHQNGQASLVAAAGAGARTLGMNAEEISRAMRIATTLLLTPSYTNTVSGATTLNVAGGMSGFVGALAPELTRAGFEAQPDAIEEALGQMVGTGFDASHLLDGLGTRFCITQNYFRLYACCNPIHPALDALGVVLATLKPRPQDIDRIDFTTYRFASVMNRRDPVNFFASKYSLPHAAAVLAVRGDLSHASLDDSALADPAITALRARVSVTEDPAMSALAPRLRPARVTVRLKDGRSAAHAVDSHRGDFNEPFDESELRAKFRSLAEHVISRSGALEIEALVDRGDTWTGLTELIEVLKQHSHV